MVLRPKNLYQISKERAEFNSSVQTILLALFAGLGIYLWYQFNSFILGACVALGLAVLMFICGRFLFKPSQTEKIKKEETKKLNEAIKAKDKEAFANSLSTLNKTIFDLEPSQQGIAEELTMGLLREAVNQTMTEPNILELSFLLCVGWNQYQYDLSANPQYYNSGFYALLQKNIREKFSNYTNGTECAICGSKDMGGSAPIHIFAQTSQEFGRTSFRGDLTVSSSFQRLGTHLPVCRKCNADRNEWWFLIHHSDLFMTYLYSHEALFGVSFDSEGNRDKINSFQWSESMGAHLPDLLFVPDEHLAELTQRTDVNLIEKMQKENKAWLFLGGTVRDISLRQPSPCLGSNLYGAKFITYPSFVTLLDHLGIGSKGNGYS